MFIFMIHIVKYCKTKTGYAIFIFKFWAHWCKKILRFADFRA